MRCCASKANLCPFNNIGEKEKKMIEEEREAFRKIVQRLLDEEEITGEIPTKLALPRSLFLSAVHMLKRGRYLTRDDILFLAREFLSVLNGRKITITKKDSDFFLGKNIKKKKSDWKTKNVWKGAFAHEKRMQLPESDR